MAINTVTDKLDEANEIKGQIRTAILSKDIPVPEGTPFSGYPALVQSIPGRLQTKNLMPDAAGQTALPDEGYDGFSSVTLPAEPDLIPRNIVTGKSIFGVDGTSEVPVFDVNDLLSGVLTELTCGATGLRAYAFYNYTALQTVVLANLTTVGNYAFYGCTGLTSVQCAALTQLAAYMCQSCSNLLSFAAGDLEEIATYAFHGCTKLATLDLSATETVAAYALYNCYKLNPGTFKATSIGSYGCYYLGSQAAAGFNYMPETAATIGTYGFQYSKMLKLAGTFSGISDYGVANCSSLTEIDAKINGALGSYALANNQYVNSLDIDPASSITSLGNYCFYYLGWSRANAAANVFTLDLRNSTCSAIGQYSFGYMKYTDIHLPATLATINQYAIRYSQYLNLYFTGAVPPTIASTNWTSNATNYKLFVPYNNANAYKTATNWTSLVANIIGYAPAGTFTAGDTLPIYNGEGMALTWYSDVARTTVITTVPAGSPELYCDSSDRSAWVVTVNEDENTTVTLVDSESVVYTTFPAYVPIGRGITIDVAEHEGWSNNTVVNGTVVTLPYTIALLSTDITVKSTSWQGEIDPDFTNCTWANIKKAVDAGVAATMFTVGSTRTITTKDNQTFTLRLSNNTDNMYEYASGGGTTGFVMEFVELWKDYKYMNPTNTNVGGWDQSYMRTTVMPLIFEQLPDDLQAVIATVKVRACESGTSGTLLSSNDKLFLPAEREIFASRSYSRTEEWNALTRWQYYANNDTATARIKKKNNSAYIWWERSPNAGYSYTFCFVSYTGNASSNYATNAFGVGPGFCI